MRSRGNAAMKFIIALGVLAFLFLFLCSFVMKKALRPNERELVTVREKYSPFDRGRAWKDLEHIVGIGPRTAGSEALGQLREYLKHELALARMPVSEHAFEAATPKGVLKMVNLVAVSQGTKPGIILLTNHYDTKLFENFRFVGANDGGSTTAWMLEMARTMGPRREGRSIWFVWLDGEESFGPWSATDGLYGSRAFVKHLKETEDLKKVEAVVNVDMIGDAYLGIHRDKNGAPWLQDLVWDTAARLGYGAHFGRIPRHMEDDDLPFREAGLTTLLLIDFSYGGSIIEHQRNWHTAEDTLEKVRAESLQAVADVIYHALPEIEGNLDARRQATVKGSDAVH